MQIEKYIISRDPKWYQAWPDVVLAGDGRLICVFNECTHHCCREHTRIMLCESFDRGRSWTVKHPLTEASDGCSCYWNCPRIFTVPDGRIGVIADRLPREGENGERTKLAENVLYWSYDQGKTWSEPAILPLRGIVPDKLRVLDTGRWLISAHYLHEGRLTQFLRYSDDGGATWSGEVLVAHDPRYHFCEASLLPLGGGAVAAFLRENSFRGLDCFKTVSTDNGETWGPVTEFPLPACHRPVSGFLRDGRVLITYRFHHGGGDDMGSRAQNFFGAVTDRASVLAEERSQARVRIFPIDHDPAVHADLGYSGWVQFPDGEIYVVSYIVDDWGERGQIRGYSLRLGNELKDV